MDAAQLGARARQEADELGPEPAGTEAELWRVERWGAVVLLVGLADPSEILVSRTVVDLTDGSGLQFEPRGVHQLKGVPGTWPTFVAVPSN